MPKTLFLSYKNHEIIITILLANIAYTDHKSMKIPDKLNLAIGVCGLVSCIQNTDVGMTDRILGLLIISVPMYILCLIIPEAFGGGDIKLAAAMGFFLGWKRTLAGAYLSFLLGGLQAIVLLIRKKQRIGETSHMAFGPALCLGMWIAMVRGNELIRWYFDLFI